MSHDSSMNQKPLADQTMLRRGIQAICLSVFLVLFLYVCWPYGASPSPDAVMMTPDQGAVPAHYAMELARKEVIPAETFLALDPLLSVSAAVAGRMWVGTLWGALIIGLFGLLIPRGFCSYLCPLGTLIDAVDKVLKGITRSKRLRDRGWGGLRFGILVLVLVAAGWGVLLAGFVAAIPVVTRGMAFAVAPLHTGVARGWHNVPGLSAGMLVSTALFVSILALGVISPRFWCRYVCPSGALLSLVSFVSVRKRRVSDACIACGKCRTACSFDAIRDDFQADIAGCTFCRACAAVCPTDAISFAPSATAAPRPQESCLPRPSGLTRRRFLTATGLGTCGALGIRYGFGAEGRRPLIRPPGSVPEREFLGSCIRCGECFRACPNNVLQPVGLEQGLEGLWSPCVVPDWSGCEPSCNNCGHVCPTGSIRALPLAEKRAARMGLAEIDRTTCLPWAGGSECQLCADECRAAGYDAIEFERIGVQVDEDGFPIEGTGVLAPVLLPEHCVGCSLCQTRCHRINVKTQRLLDASAVQVRAGAGREDRMTHGSYLALREQERRDRLERGRALELSRDAADG